MLGNVKVHSQGLNAVGMCAFVGISWMVHCCVLTERGARPSVLPGLAWMCPTYQMHGILAYAVGCRWEVCVRCIATRGTRSQECLASILRSGYVRATSLSPFSPAPMANSSSDLVANQQRVFRIPLCPTHATLGIAWALEIEALVMHRALMVLHKGRKLCVVCRADGR